MDISNKQKFFSIIKNETKNSYIVSIIVNEEFKSLRDTNKILLSVSHLKCSHRWYILPWTHDDVLSHISLFATFPLPPPPPPRCIPTVTVILSRKRDWDTRWCVSRKGNNRESSFGLGSRVFSQRTTPFCSIPFPVAALIYALELLIYAASMEFHECEM